MLFVPQWLYSSSPTTTSNPPDDAAPAESLVEKLEHFKKQGELPPSSRIDLSLEQREYQGRSLTDLWKYGVLIATKATDIASDLVRHKIVGARKKSWGIEMTILSALMRNVGKHSSLTDLPMLRAMMAISGLAPLPSDAIVTPVTFRARKRDLRGFLAEHDAKEDGSRVLSAEWVIGKKLWFRLQEEWRRAKADGNGKRPRHRHERVILFLHGGAYYMFSAATHRTITIPLSKYTDARVFAVDYRLAPETRFPGQLHDAVLAYLRLIEDLHIPPENLVVCGDSAGGGLTMALLLYLRDNKYPLPAACMLMSPWVDLTMSCDSWDSNAEFDLVPTPEAGDHLNPILCLLGSEGTQKYLTHPYASPLFGEMEGLPPLLIQTGDAEVLRDESMLLAHKATLAGVNVRHEIYEDQVHVFQMFFFLEATQKAMLSCREFVNNTLRPQFGSSSGPKEIAKEVEASLEKEMNSKATKIVRGDGSVMDYKQLSDLGGPSRTSNDGTPDNSRTSSDIEPSWVEAPDSRDGTNVNRDEDDDDERPSSPISLKPKRKTPPLQPSSFTSYQFPLQPSTSPHMTSTLKSQAPSSARSQSFFARKQSSSLMTPASNEPAPNVLREKNSNTNLGRQRTQMNISLTSSNAPPPFSFALPTSSHSSHNPYLTPSSPRVQPLLARSPSVPSIRRRERAMSHPDIFKLCQSWQVSGPANESVVIDAGHIKGDSPS